MKNNIDKIVMFIKFYIALWVLSSNSLSVMTTGYTMDIPIIKIFFTVLNVMDGWGVETLFTALGLGVIFYLVRDRQKNAWVSGLSAFFAVCTVIGISYEQANSWNFLFLYGLQFILAVFVITGYYFLYKNCMLFIIYIYKKWALFKREPAGKLEIFLFSKHTFLGPLLFLFILGLPWLIFYFPGTLHWDALVQLNKSFGILPKDAHHPVLISEYMGLCIRLGKSLLHSDSLGFFLYTGPQFICQWLVFAYASHVISKRNVPVLIRWGALLYWGLHPLLPIWGFTMAKDSISYISATLLIAVLMEICSDSGNQIRGYQAALFLASIAGITLSRNEGRYIVMFTVICGILLYKKYWKLFLGGALACLLLIGAEYQYMSYYQIPGGEVGEMLSIPLQQIARYLKEHYDEVTEEEAEILGKGFMVGLDQVITRYNPIVSDPVKGVFVAHPDKEYLKEFFSVWFHLLLKHPDTYIQAFINQTYGYFYPNQHNWKQTKQVYAAYSIAGGDQLQNDYFHIKFFIKDESIRNILEQNVFLVEKAPILGLLLSPGMYVYVLIGESIYLLAKKKRRELLVFLPGFFVLLICLLSPVNGYLRYLLPIIAAMPITLGWCFTAGSDKLIMHSDKC